MLLKLLGFFEDTTTGSGDSNGNLGLLIIGGVMLVAMIFMMIIPQRKQKKRAEEMMSRLAVGSTIITIGGIVGEVVQMDEKHIWIATGTEENKSVMQFVRQAIHSVEPDAQQTNATQETSVSSDDDVDEIR